MRHTADMVRMAEDVNGPVIVRRTKSKQHRSSTGEAAYETVVDTAPKQTLEDFTRIISSPHRGSCSICMCDLSETSGFSDDGDDDGKRVLELVLCNHVFHHVCLKHLPGISASYLECPVCKTIHGIRTGNQPSGVMEIMDSFETPPGFSGCGTIVINYYFADGMQGPEHPDPGQLYRAYAFPRQAYLPNNTEGKKVLRLLEEAYRRRLVFTIGTSVTTGMKNVITWNEIHHKTSLSSSSAHGYPDPMYLENVTMELAMQGVTEDSIAGNL